MSRGGDMTRAPAARCQSSQRSPRAEIYNWFSEGFDTADLKDAMALDEMNVTPRTE